MIPPRSFGADLSAVLCGPDGSGDQVGRSGPAESLTRPVIDFVGDRLQRLLGTPNDGGRAADGSHDVADTRTHVVTDPFTQTTPLRSPPHETRIFGFEGIL